MASGEKARGVPAQRFSPSTACPPHRGMLEAPAGSELAGPDAGIGRKDRVPFQARHAHSRALDIVGCKQTRIEIGALERRADQQRTAQQQ